MVLARAPLPALLARWVGEDAYKRRIGRGLTKAWARAPSRQVELTELRAVVMSDHHRGQGDPADDFQRCEAAYCAALGWYLEEGYELWLLGDVEELWENRPPQVLDRYCNVLELERAFGDRLSRFYGNHDMAWMRRRNVERFLQAHAPGTQVRESLRIVVTDSGSALGTLFLVHGHQGTIDSGNLLVVPFSRFAVRTFWGALQRWRGFANTSPATNNVLRSRHDRAMATWADKHAERLVLVSGHTHHPVFPGTFPPDFRSRAAEAESAYQDAVRAGTGVPGARATRELAQARALRDEPYVPPDLDRPSYFNSGCCSFGDGDITCLEFSGSNVRLVRWLEDGGTASAHQLEDPKDLRSVLSAVTGRVPALPSTPAP